jgi:hypothetical protein
MEYVLQNKDLLAGFIINLARARFWNFEIMYVHVRKATFSFSEMIIFILASYLTVLFLSLSVSDFESFQFSVDGGVG